MSVKNIGIKVYNSANIRDPYINTRNIVIKMLVLENFISKILVLIVTCGLAHFK